MREMMRIRDGRRVGWHWANNEIIDHYAKRIGMQGYAIYMYLSRYASQDSGECCKSQNDIAETFGVSRDTVNRHLQILVDENLLTVTHEPGKPSVYTLKDSGEHLPQIQTPPIQAPAANSDTPPLQNQTGVAANSDTHNRKKEIEIKNNPLPPFKTPEPSAEPYKIEIYGAAKGLGELIGLNHRGNKLHTLAEAINQAERRWPDKHREDVVIDIVAMWKEYTAQGHHAPVALHNWLDGIGSYIDSDHWKKKPAAEGPARDEEGGYFEGNVYVKADGTRMPGYVPRRKTNAK